MKTNNNQIINLSDYIYITNIESDPITMRFKFILYISSSISFTLSSCKFDLLKEFRSYLVSKLGSQYVEIDYNKYKDINLIINTYEKEITRFRKS